MVLLLLLSTTNISKDLSFSYPKPSTRKTLCKEKIMTIEVSMAQQLKEKCKVIAAHAELIAAQATLQAALLAKSADLEKEQKQLNHESEKELRQSEHESEGIEAKV